MLFTAGNLMPQQVIFQPLFQIYKRVPIPDFLQRPDTGTARHQARRHPHPRRLPDRLLHVRALQLHEDHPQGARRGRHGRRRLVPRQYFQVILPLCRPALAALATLEFTWLYNDFFWGAVLLNQGSERPITSSIAVLNGQYATTTT